jgi:hypothetical protein
MSIQTTSSPTLPDSNWRPVYESSRGHKRVVAWIGPDVNEDRQLPAGWFTVVLSVNGREAKRYYGNPLLTGTNLFNPRGPRAPQPGLFMYSIKNNG